VLVEDEKNAGFSLADLKNWSDIAKALETVSSADELKEWLRGCLFKPFFMHFYRTALLPEQIRKKSTRGQGFASILQCIINAANSGDTRFTSQYPNCTGWGLREYTAQFIAQVIDANTKDRDGLFHGRNWPDDWKEKVTWRIFQLVKADFALTRVLKQGRALLALDQTEVETIRSFIMQDQEKASSEVPLSRTPTPNSGERTKSTDTANSGSRDSADTVPEVANINGEEDSPYAAELPAGDWRAQAIIPTKRRVLNPSSTRMNMSDPWWQYKFIDNAIKNAPQSPSPLADTAVENLASGQPRSRASPRLNQISVEPEEELQVPDMLSSLKHMIMIVLVVNPYNAPMQWDTVWHEKLEVSDITLESPLKPELIKPDKAAIARAQEQQDWLDNPELQRENHEEACAALGIDDLDRPKLKGMRISAVLRFWQLVAINMIREFVENLYLSSAILANSIGLGKTWTTVGYLL
ncbi:hypothetical protein BDW72DRAFT_188978, partial [Aspergillus terricola var. indicus]